MGRRRAWRRWPGGGVTAARVSGRLAPRRSRRCLRHTGRGGRRPPRGMPRGVPAGQPDPSGRSTGGTRASRAGTGRRRTAAAVPAGPPVARPGGRPPGTQLVLHLRCGPAVGPTAGASRGGTAAGHGPGSTATPGGSQHRRQPGLRPVRLGGCGQPPVWPCTAAALRYQARARPRLPTASRGLGPVAPVPEAGPWAEAPPLVAVVLRYGHPAARAGGPAGRGRPTPVLLLLARPRARRGPPRRQPAGASQAAGPQASAQRWPGASSRLRGW